MPAAILACMTFLITALVMVKLQLVVRIYDAAGVAPGDMDRACASVSAILTRVGIEPIWRPCPGTVCTEIVTPDEVVVRIVRSGSESPNGSLGYSMIDKSTRAGTLATIYDDRVHALAAESHLDEGLLLGRAMAHEIGHLLLGTSNHSGFGLMRGRWLSDELQRDRQADWVFTSWERADLRHQLVARARQPMLPASVAAELAQERQPALDDGVGH